MGDANQSWESGGTADALPAERARASFSTETMITLLDGGKRNTLRRRWIQSVHADDENRLSADRHVMSREQLTAASAKQFLEIHVPIAKKGEFKASGQDIAWMSEASVSFGPISPHYGLFIPTLLGQCSAQQKRWWLERSRRCEIIGGYAQTELGHGSNVRGLRTVAAYDAATQEFVLDTPTLQAMKWWNSNVGCAATHAAVYAQLVTQGVERGVHVFMLQLRDEHHRLLPGIEAGDVGPKLGDNAIDCGFLRLCGVRIPREHLMAKRQHVEPDGTYVRHSKGGGGGGGGGGGNKMAYLTMMGARIGMVAGAGAVLANAATIAVRYSCVRRQGFAKNRSGGGGGSAAAAPPSFQAEELPVMEYGVQQRRLFGHVATAYATKFAAKWISRRVGELLFSTMSSGGGDGSGDGGDGDGGGGGGDGAAEEELPELHATSAGLKGLCCRVAADGIEDCRRACGGHGFLLSSGVAALAADYVWKVTAEGDFVVMLLQTARYLMKMLARVRRGEPPPPTGLCASFAPLAAAPYVPAAQYDAASAAELLDLPHLVGLFERRALLAVAETGDELDAHLAAAAAAATAAAAGSGAGDVDGAWNACAASLTAMAEAFLDFFVLDKFMANVAEAAEEDGACGAALGRLCLVSALGKIVDGAQWHGIVGRATVAHARSALLQTLAQLRPDAVALVDAFDIADHVLASDLGRHDGNVYEALFASAQRSPLNTGGRFEGYASLEPYLDKRFLALRNAVCPDEEGTPPSKL